MTQDEIIRMARDGIKSYLSNGGLFNPEEMNHDKVRELIMLCRDALDLVAAHEREKQAKLMILNGKSVVEQVHSYVSRNDTDFTSESMAKMVCDFIAAEREACAKVCDELKWRSPPLNFAENCAAVIRARGQ